jgi:hypothetical protein
MRIFQLAIGQARLVASAACSVASTSFSKAGRGLSAGCGLFLEAPSGPMFAAHSGAAAVAGWRSNVFRPPSYRVDPVSQSYRLPDAFDPQNFGGNHYVRAIVFGEISHGKLEPFY